jgi:hypothetical protein
MLLVPISVPTGVGSGKAFTGIGLSSSLLHVVVIITKTDTMNDHIIFFILVNLGENKKHPDL